MNMKKKRSCLLGAIACILLMGCDALTDVYAPDVVQPKDVDNAEGAAAFGAAAIDNLYGQFASLTYTTGRFSDELYLASAYNAFAAVDYREQALTYTEWGPVYLGQGRTFAKLGIDLYLEHAPEERAAIGQLYAVRGLAAMFLGEVNCNGTPLSEVEDLKAQFGGPITSDSMTARAVAELDQALEYASGDARILNLAKVARGRALTNRGLFGDAAGAVAGVPTDYVYNAELNPSGYGRQNPIFNANSNLYATVSNGEGTNGLDFVSANDPRVPTELVGTGTDGVTEVYQFMKYTDEYAPIVIASGIEARLIEAEAALQAGGGNWLTILNDLRATAIDPPMEPLMDPGTQDARVDLLFSERAFWLFGTGHRMGDLRRLLRQYGRSQNDTYPVGHYKGPQNYGTDVVFILTLSEQSNPEGFTCLDRNP
jgi:hypothetical protein